MSIFEAIILGIVQGLTEFLPISSSGHLLIVPAIMGWEDPGAAFTAVIQLGTMAAVLIYFREDIWKITSAFLRGLVRRAATGGADDIRMGWYLGLGTLPIIVFGVAFSDQIENGARNLYSDRLDADRLRSCARARQTCSPSTCASSSRSNRTTP